MNIVCSDVETWKLCVDIHIPMFSMSVGQES